LYPAEYKKIIDHLAKSYASADELREAGIERLWNMCSEEHITVADVK
jgi:hypothetical protein